MYKAIHIRTGEEIVILNPAWRKRIDLLREMDHADDLVCQGCHQPLRVKAGEVKRPHFAHKHLKACSYGSETPEILNARAVLYEWLLKEYIQGKGLGNSVTLEKKIDGVDLPRPIDCWVETTSDPIAYWIIEAGIKLEPRQAILAAFERLGVHVHFVFLHTMLNKKKEHLNSLLLTPTERAFLKTTAFDQVLAGPVEAGSSLHYLDAEQSMLTTYRSLVRFHPPNWYHGVKKVSKLQAVKISHFDGEFIHRGEAERLSAFGKKMERLEEKRKRYAERESAWENRLSRGRSDGPREKTPPARWESGRQEHGFGEPLPCAICGQITADYWSTFTAASGRRLCRCRECLGRNR